MDLERYAFCSVPDDVTDEGWDALLGSSAAVKVTAADGSEVVGKVVRADRELGFVVVGRKDAAAVAHVEEADAHGRGVH